jgi:hypothetical protein
LFWKDQFEGIALNSPMWEIRGISSSSIGYISADAVEVEDGCLKLCTLQRGDSLE